MINNKDLIKKISLYIALYILVFSVIFYTFISKNFQINNDSLFQYEIFYKEWLKIIIHFLKTGKFNTFSFNMFLGTDFYSSMGYYCIGDIFLPLLLVFRNSIATGLLIETILCVFISGITMSLFLNKVNIKNEKIIIFISIIYAIGGQAILYVQNYMFHRFYAFLPLLFLGLEYYFKEHKRSLFIVAVFILFLQNYYFMYMTLIFLFMYSLTECFQREYKIKTIVYSFIDLLFSILIGFLLSSVVVLPSMIDVIGNVTSRHSVSGYSYWEINSVIGIFLSIISINPVDAISTIFNLPYDYHGSGYNIFITIIPLVYVISNMSNKKNKKRNILLVLLFVIAITKPLNSIMHGFSVPSLRWLFLLEFYLLYLSAIYMDNDCDKKKMLLSFIFVILFAIASIIVLYLLGYVWASMKKHLIYILVGIMINVCISIFYFNNERLAYILSICFILGSTIFYYDNLSTEKYIPVLSKEEMDYRQKYENTYYRYYNSYLNTYFASPLDSNSSLLYNIMTSSTYSSTYDTNIKKFLDIKDNSISNEWNLEINDHELLSMLGTKYYIVGNRIENNYISSSNLEYKYSLHTYGDYDIYYNKDYRGFGYCAENINYFDNYGKNPNENFLNTVYVDDDSIDILNYSNLSYSKLIINKMEDNHISAKISNKENNILLIPFPNNIGWKIIDNDHVIKPINVNGGFIGLQLDKGIHNIEMDFSTPYLKLGAVLSCAGLIILVFVIMKEERKA